MILHRNSTPLRPFPFSLSPLGHPPFPSHPSYEIILVSLTDSLDIPHYFTPSDLCCLLLSHDILSFMV